jgi:uncharacterized protein (TIGR00159 family)
LPLFEELRARDLVDIAIVATLLWLVIAWLRNSRARLALVGLGAIAALFGLARTLELQLTTVLLQGFFAAVAVMLVVVFQEDLRRLFEVIAVWTLRRGAPRPPPETERVLVRSLFRLAAEKVGALVVMPGREPLERHLEGGVYLDGRLSEPLLLSLFDPATPGHDGAVIVRANKVSRFGVHLPLSTDWDQLGGLGTRHAAALGLSERSDALCLVVSEERGTVSIAQAGRLERVGSSERLGTALHDFIERTSSGARLPSDPRELLARLRASWREGAVAFAAAVLLWALSVPGSTVERFERAVPVVVENLPEGYELSEVEPSTVSVRFEGPRRDRYLSRSLEVNVRVDALLVKLGRRTFDVSVDDVQVPPGLRVVSVEPARIRLNVQGPERNGPP